MDVMYKIYANNQKLKYRKSLRNWINRIVINKYIDEKKYWKMIVYVGDISFFCEKNSYTQINTYNNESFDENLDRILYLDKSKNKSVVELLLNGFTPKEISKKLNINTKKIYNIKQRLK
jgi:DNA-directed RNA polymerase specialized sigma24 family protein